MNFNDMRNGKISTRIPVIFKLMFLCLFVVNSFNGMAQYDYEHYVPPFYDGSNRNDDVGRHTAVLSTNSTNNVEVFIYKGDGTLLNAGEPIVITRGTPYEYIFKTPLGGDYGKVLAYPSSYDFPLGVVGAVELNKPLPDTGLRFFSADGPFFVNIRHVTAVHGGSLTAKGTYAKGTDFRSGHLFNYSLPSWYRDRRSHFISVMATEDTDVSFSDIKCSFLSTYNAGILSLRPISATDVITVSLKKGESYLIAVDFEFSSFYNLGTNAWNGLNGTHITSTKPIVVNTGSWTAGADDAQEIGIDQIVPTDQLRDKYVVMRGKGVDIDQERTIVVATEDNTEVYINGNSSPSYTIANKGDFVILDDLFNSRGDVKYNNLFIDTKGKSVYVYQTMSGDVYKTNIGLNFIPPLSSTGMKEVTIPFADYLAGKQVSDAAITILTQKNAVVEYQKTVGGVTTYYTLSLADAIAINGNSEWVSYIIEGDVHGNYRFNSNKAINVAWTVRSGWVGAAGYYSGFTKAISQIIPELNVDADLDLICESYDADIKVSIKDPLPDFYEWYVNDLLGDPFIKNAALVVPAPDVETSYYVLGYYRDPELDILFNGDFSDGYNGFESGYEKVSSNLTSPGQFAITFSPISENPIFEDFGALDGGSMFLAYSKDQGDEIYRVDEIPVEENFSYIFKLHGRLAKSIGGNFYSQSLKVLINNDTIIDNFKIDDTQQWESSAALWKPGVDRKATIRILNNNPSSQDAVFALDSISFVQAVVDTALFVARVVPNYSYDNNGGVFHFCKGISNSLDVSNGDTSWYNYS